MELKKILDLIPNKLLQKLAVETEVNIFSKKLYGEVVFKLLVYCILSQKDNSLRAMESTYESLFFKLLSQKFHKGKVSYSSISTRLSSINPDYFEHIFKICIKMFKKELGDEKEQVVRFDSTIVSLGTKLLNVGYHLKGGDADRVRQLKFTIGYSNNIPEIAQFYQDQQYTSENVALKEVILLQAEHDKKSIKVFDRGITSRNTYDEFTDKEILFISRLNNNAVHNILEKYDEAIKTPIETETLTIFSDNWCELYSSSGKAKKMVRRVETVVNESRETMVFVTNIKNLSAVEITELYKKRWEIEVFFKFIKQLLNFSHLINRTENGIKVMLYATMIASVLLTVFKKSNKLAGYKIPIMKFLNELEIEIVRELVILCDGNEKKLNEILLYNTS
jgi:hypothetical protein